MASEYGLLVVHIPTGQIVVPVMAPGRSPGELDLVERIVARAQAKGVGLLRSESHALDAMRTAMLDEFQAVKDRV